MVYSRIHKVLMTLKKYDVEALLSVGQEPLAECLAEEERQIRAEDRRYWQVLRNELEAMRHNRKNQISTQRYKNRRGE